VVRRLAARLQEEGLRSCAVADSRFWTRGPGMALIQLKLVRDEELEWHLARWLRLIRIVDESAAAARQRFDIIAAQGPAST
jgi:hypothetical protein